VDFRRKLDVVDDDNREFRFSVIKDKTPRVQLVVDMERTARTETANEVRPEKRRDVAGSRTGAKDTRNIRLVRSNSGNP